MIAAGCCQQSIGGQNERRILVDTMLHHQPRALAKRCNVHGGVGHETGTDGKFLQQPHGMRPFRIRHSWHVENFFVRSIAEESFHDADVTKQFEDHESTWERAFLDACRLGKCKCIHVLVVLAQRNGQRQKCRNFVRKCFRIRQQQLAQFLAERRLAQRQFDLRTGSEQSQCQIIMLLPLAAFAKCQIRLAVQYGQFAPCPVRFLQI
mmetsp:Transcript_14262/g.40599  ORF Transcript_14262/g.40599 Transcript_14262/m.40599 type:complete len:207 (-) Transcript_14262:369-989(-)